MPKQVKPYDQHKVEQCITAMLKSAELLGCTPVETMVAARSIHMSISAKAKANKGRRFL